MTKNESIRQGGQIEQAGSHLLTEQVGPIVAAKQGAPGSGMFCLFGDHRFAAVLELGLGADLIDGSDRRIRLKPSRLNRSFLARSATKDAEKTHEGTVDDVCTGQSQHHPA
jgi:hypothetical protein